MNMVSPMLLKRRRLMNFNSIESASAKAKLLAAKEKYGREVRVFDTLGTPQSVTEIADTEDSEDFYNITPEDYIHLVGTKKREDNYLKTRKIREAEQAARRSRMKKATVRVRFPDNHTLEATFHPSETIQSLVDLVEKSVARPELPFYLYTTPPKKQIKDATQDFFSAGFVPGAIVYFSYDVPKEDEAHSGPYLGDELMALKALELPTEPTVADNPSPEQTPTPVIPAPPIVEQGKQTEKKAIKPKWLGFNLFN